MAHGSDLTGHSLLAVFAHPDDESIACGGVLARCAERGVHVTLICATHGESSPGGPDAHLFQERPRELTEAARVLGIAEVVLLDYPDGYLPWSKGLQQRLETEIRRIRPDVVVTFGRDGLYWHPDHIAVCEQTTAAVEALGADAPVLYYVTMPVGAMRRLAEAYSHTSATPTVLGVRDHDAWGVDAAPATLIVDVSGYARQKLTALRCHRTQVADGMLAYLEDREAGTFLGLEYFHRAPTSSSRQTFLDATCA